MEQEIKRRGRPKKEATIEQVQETQQAEESNCGHNSLIEDGRGTYCALCGKRV